MKSNIQTKPWSMEPQAAMQLYQTRVSKYEYYIRVYNTRSRVYTSVRMSVCTLYIRVVVVFHTRTYNSQNRKPFRPNIFKRFDTIFSNC